MSLASARHKASAALEEGPALRYRAFISYSHKDRHWARWLMRRLETYRTPVRLVGKPGLFGTVRSRLTPLFRDRDELASGSDLTTTIREALASSEALIVIASPSSAASRWVNQEVIEFKRLGRDNRVYAFVVDGDPTARDGPEACLAPALRHPVEEDGSLGAAEVELIAADARPEGDGKKRALVRLIAGLLGVAFDDLRQREVQRRQKRLIALSAGSLVGMTVAIVLAVTAFVARQDAERRREQAEDLLGFMVGDLRESLEPIGRLELLERVGDKALDYFATAEPSDVSDLGLARQAKVLTQIGSVRLAQLDYDAAAQAFSKAYGRSAELAARNPGNGEILFERGQAEFWIGYASWQKGVLGTAREWFQRYRDTGLELAAMDPARDEWVREVGYGFHNLGAVAVKAGELDRAREDLSSELQILEDLAIRNPGEEQLQEDIADCLSWLGTVAELDGRLSEARDYYGRSAERWGRLVEATPDHAHRLYWWSAALLHEAEMLLYLGDRQSGGKLIDRAIGVRRQLVERDPENEFWNLNLRKLEIFLAEVGLAGGETPADVEAALERQIRLLEGLRKLDADDEEVSLALVRAHRVAALAAMLGDNLPGARRHVEMSLEIADRLGEDPVNRRVAAMERAASRVVFEQLRDPATREDGFHARLSEVSADLAAAAGGVRWPPLMEVWSRVLERQGLGDEAAEIRRMLGGRGYLPLWSWQGFGLRHAVPRAPAAGGST